MRQPPAALTAAWRSGDYTGDQRAMARVTVQQARVGLHSFPYNTYASLIFGATEAPKELPNVKSIKWTRGVDQDAATATIVFYNTSPLPLGQAATRDLDRPGYYTFDRGRTSFANRWGQTPNEWSSLLVPDNILRTYEGYGFDASVIPELDTHLMSTGVWRIDQVDFAHDGLITCTCRDISSILMDQIIFVPVVPKNFYPLFFAATTKKPGINQGRIYATAASIAKLAAIPSGWVGPTTTVSSITSTVSAGVMTLTVTGNNPSEPAGYRRIGFQLSIDGILDPTVHHFGAGDTGIVLVPYAVLGGTVHDVTVRDLWQRAADGTTQLVNPGNNTTITVRPGTASVGAVTPGSININTGPPPPPSDPVVPVLGSVSWNYTGAPASFTVVAFNAAGGRHVYTAPVVGTGGQYFQTGLPDCRGWDFLIYPKDAGGVAGLGDLFTADGAYLAPPVQPSGAPQQPSTLTGATVTSPTSGAVTPLKPQRLPMPLSDSSNAYYVGKDGAVLGHLPEQAFDGNPATYWLSVGNQRNDQGYSYEWIEGALPGVELVYLEFSTVLSGYQVYISVFADGRWVTNDPAKVIPYDPSLPESHNGGNIPYLQSYAATGGEGPHRVTLVTPVKNATKVRLTFRNLQYFSGGTYHYRAAVREFTAWGAPGSPSGAGVTQQDGTVYVPPSIVSGAGENPGTYYDYTDIVKLLCAWGGFFWPNNGQQILSDGSTSTYGFGMKYGFLNVDPVLGTNAGRVWGDFMDTGTAGIAPLPIPQWDKKSLMDGINFVRDIIGFLFYIDEDGAVVWRLPNLFAIGNYVGNNAQGATRAASIVTLDEKVTLIGLTASLNSANVRERYFVADLTGKTGALAQGYNPNPIGLRRVGGWTDQHFGSVEECQVMADMIALRALLTYRTDSVVISGYPGIQIDDQVRIFEQVTGEGYLHYVTGISSDLDLENGKWTYTLDTQWLGEHPFSNWIFDPAGLSKETKIYLATLNAIPNGSF